MSEAGSRDLGAGLDPQALAERVRDGMFANDSVSQGLGMRFEAVGPGYAKMSMTVREDMLNGFRICHGGFITTLADSAFAFSCNSYNEQTVASGVSVDFVAPGRPGDVLTAEASEVFVAGRTGVYDIVVTNQNNELIAVMRGKSYRLKGRPVVEP
ncbi:MAG TPA: hydroxyphenylacetyl-CoA thioesterase PaaI [Rhodocyclaceae bacterium]|nr:hydroxyphenylacetyl-CoA thioesterase PaaI [Rhodocyclaceae bacterium]